MIDTQVYYAKLAQNKALTEDEVVALLKAVTHFRDLAAYLADCQAATMQGLPKSASQSARRRHANICVLAAKGLAGDITAVRYPGQPDAVIERCHRAALEGEQKTN